ncbi:MAG: MerR family transcriptional regulator [Thermoanaerobaculaceae bacterium]
MNTKKRYHMISWVAKRYNIHPQTLRLYEREGLIRPARSEGNTRLYDDTTCERLELILTLTREMGVNLAGVEVILRMKRQMDALQKELLRVTEALEREKAKRGAMAREHALVPHRPQLLIPSEDE